jgi:8-oxo-dGTP pyrophosphatase MutT (NUDIX family)
MVDINKIGLAVIKDDKLLLCLKYKESKVSALILPGGKIESEETDLECLKREIKEEFDSEIEGKTKYLGTFEGIAASDDPSVKKTVQIKLYLGNIKDPQPSREIKEIVWFDRESDQGDLSPILKNKIIPFLLEKRLLKW